MLCKSNERTEKAENNIQKVAFGRRLRRRVVKDIVKFYRGEISNDNHDMFDEILQWDDDKMERSHSTIQWMFPLNESSKAQPFSPVLSDFQIQEMKSCPKIRANLLKALSSWALFYGLSFTADLNDDGSWSVEHQITNQNQFSNWITPRNHNYLRLTRIMRCLVLLGLQDFAISLYKCLKTIYHDYSNIIPAITMDFWSDAVKDVHDIEWITGQLSF